MARSLRCLASAGLGLTAPMRGLWQDDTLLLQLARTFQGHGFMAALTPAGAPLRLLYTLAIPPGARDTRSRSGPCT